MTLEINKPAPEFELIDQNGETHKLSDYLGKRVVLYFYPKAGTSGCTTQACGIRDAWTKFQENDIKVFGISVDSKESITEFIADHNLNFPLLSDENKEVSKTYGVLNNLGLSNRITFIIDKDGTIAKIIRDVDIANHADDILNYASALK